MFIRIRKSNLSLERAIYKPAEKDADGKIMVQAVRTTEYLGSMNAHEQYWRTPSELLAKLDEAEKAELKEALKGNESKPDFWLSRLPGNLGDACNDLAVCEALAKSPEARKALEAQVKAVEAAWNSFFKVAQGLGLKRKLNRGKQSPAKREANPMMLRDTDELTLREGMENLPN